MTTAPDNAARSWLQIALLIAGALVLVGISATSVYYTSRAREDANRVTHTVEVENQIGVTLLQIRRAESSERAFLITSLPAYRTDFDEAKSFILPAFAALRRLTQDNATQHAILDQIDPLVQQRLGEFDTVNALTEAGKFGEATAIVRQSAIDRTTDKIRALCEQMQDEEQRLFALRTAAADQSQRVAALVTTSGSGLVLLLAALSVTLVRRSDRARQRAEWQLRDANVNLESTVAERTASLREANEEIQRFAYIVSHDLRSPLVNIMGFTSELETLRHDLFARLQHNNDDLAPPTQPGDGADHIPAAASDKALWDNFDEALGFIKTSIDKMDRLISAILKLTREGRREFRPESIDVRDLITIIAGTLAHQTAEAGAEIDIQALPDLTSDRLALEQIFSNLIDNALKYLKAGTPGRITIKGRHKLGYVIYEVADNGRGIDPKDHQRIFDLFRRAGLQDRPGQGIGLAHVRALVRRLGGTLSVTSEPGQGSTFTVTLPSRWTLGIEGKAE